MKNKSKYDPTQVWAANQRGAQITEEYLRDNGWKVVSGVGGLNMWERKIGRKIYLCDTGSAVYITSHGIRNPKEYKSHEE